MVLLSAIGCLSLSGLPGFLGQLVGKPQKTVPFVLLWERRFRRDAWVSSFAVERPLPQNRSRSARSVVGLELFCPGLRCCLHHGVDALEGVSASFVRVWNVVTSIPVAEQKSFAACLWKLLTQPFFLAAFHDQNKIMVAADFTAQFSGDMLTAG